MLRVFGFVAAATFALAAAIVTFPQIFHVEDQFPIAQVVSFRGLVAVAFAGLGLLALLFALARPLRVMATTLAIVCLAAAIGNGVVLYDRGWGTETLPASTEDSLRVMTWNTAGSGNTSAGAIAEIAVAMQADIITLPETSADTGEQVAIAMRDYGRPMWVHHATFGSQDSGWDALSTTILISPDLGDYAVIESSRDGTSNTSTVPSAVVMPTSGDGPTVVAAHAVAPRVDDMQQWRSDLQWLADQCAVDNVIMAGDFNATVDHMAALGVDGGTLGRCLDAASETGNGAVGTWPSQLPSHVGAPIDHILASPSWVPTGSIVLRSMDGSGSDHRPLIVQYEPAG
ncbi:endonuclease/exonuclease/phosphatase family protein [Microbacterium xanthum]|uniref:endonuclease/exonuclease/phosphatase family protein n=1 Tax=Microbacterium xanthum TaxID=3079794 RepID=UPI002AD28444|nr:MULTISPECIES: endonuclease/exonuclease/phosphatase family protein [unclassified Microbacterium]MDZ8172155.1 endonuclease/exonuclease/phosphatase family protein [Microbacterium sp. KSW-48]MDZ8202138.1 endonuclease/exonuclease/phosphatase family protein [Microbacterium sp. SSW1-59]